METIKRRKRKNISLGDCLGNLRRAPSDHLLHFFQLHSPDFHHIKYLINPIFFPSNKCFTSVIVGILALHFKLGPEPTEQSAILVLNAQIFFIRSSLILIFKSKSYLSSCSGKYHGSAGE